MLPISHWDKYAQLPPKNSAIDFEIGAHTGAKKEFLHTIYAPFFVAPSVYALVSRMAARIAYRIAADMYE